MGSGPPCKDPTHRPLWRVRMRRYNESAFNGYHRTPSDWSQVVCEALTLPARCVQWRTRAGYVDTLPDLDPAEDLDAARATAGLAPALEDAGRG